MNICESLTLNARKSAAALLTVSALGIAAICEHESYSATAYVPVKGDVATIGYGATHYTSGEPVRLGDTITRSEAVNLLTSTVNADAVACLHRTIPNVAMTQGEFDVAVDFVYWAGCGNWKISAVKRDYLRGASESACRAYGNWHKAAGRDCCRAGSGCAGVCTRAKWRVNQCLKAQKKAAN
jgi:GH24 family phage-related lysozyme (muramidase)